MGDYWSLIQSMGFLLLILVLAYLVLRYGLKSIYRGVNGHHLKVVEKTILDPKNGSSLLLVQVGDEVHLVGAAQGGVSLLKSYSVSELEDDGIDGNNEPGSIKKSFSRVLKNFQKREGSNNDPNGGL